MHYLISHTLKDAYETYEENVCESLTNLNNIDVVDSNIKLLDGDSFTFIIKKIKKDEFYSMELMNSITLLDIIDNDNIANYLYGSGIIFGFSNINKDDINNIIDTEELVLGQKIYLKKIILEKEHRELFPSFIIVYNNISDDVLEFSKTVNMPIVIINTDKYINKGV